MLKAGGAYLPLDPAYPADRLAFMFEDAGAARVLTRRRLAAPFAAVGEPVICLDEVRQALADEAEGDPGTGDPDITRRT